MKENIIQFVELCAVLVTDQSFGVKENIVRPFNLELAINGHAVRTRCGYKVDYVWFSNDDSYPLTFEIVSGGDGPIFYVDFTEDGKYLEGTESVYDLFMVDEEV